MFKYFVLLLVLASQCATRCTIRKNYLAICDSIEDVYNANPEESSTWDTVEIRSKEKLQKLNGSVLASIPNVRKIVLISSVDDLADFTFAASSTLYSVLLFNCNLPTIKKNWFVYNNYPRTDLFIEGCNVSSFETECFRESFSLSYFSFIDNNISRITTNVFNGTFFIELNLIGNRIEVIEEDAFADMSRLKFLDLNRNLLTSFNSKLILKNTYLIKLNLNRNKIKSFSGNNFDVLKKLEQLHLNSNELELIEDGAFNGLRNLWYLNVNNNSLSSFPERAFPLNGLPNLLRLNLAFNRMNYLPKSFLLYFPKLTTICIFGNPWQCACYKDIRKAIHLNNVEIACNNIFLNNGSRPVCVVPQFGGNKCLENIQDPNDLYETYMNSLVEDTTESRV